MAIHTWEWLPILVLIKIVVEEFVLLAFQKSFIKFHYQWILVGFLDDHGVVCVVKTFCSGCFGSVAGSGWLSATHDTATSACHYFDQMIFCLAVLLRE